MILIKLTGLSDDTIFIDGSRIESIVEETYINLETFPYITLQSGKGVRVKNTIDEILDLLAANGIIIR